jgi:hypothetical protein
MTSIGNKRYLSLASSNDGSAGVFGGAGLATAGPTQIRFEVSNEGLLQTPELRFQGTLRIRRLAATAAGGVGGGATVAGAQLSLIAAASTQDVNLNAMCGCQGLIDGIEIGSRINSTRSIEKIQNYGQLASSMMSAVHSKTGYDCQLSHEQQSRGVGFTTPSSTFRGAQATPGGLAFTDYSKAADTTANQIQSARRALCQTGGCGFDMRLVAGMFMGQAAIDLEAVGGLAITINLAAPSQVLAGANAALYTYDIVNPRLVVPVVEKTPEQQMALAQQPTSRMEFLTYQSLYSTVSSTSQQLVSRVSYQGLVSTFTHFLPVNHLQSFARDGYGQYNPGLVNLTFLKDGKRAPLEYQLLPVTVPPGGAANQGAQPSYLSAELWQYLDSFRNTRDITKSLINPLISGYSQQTGAPGTNSAVFGVGCSFDDVSHVGVDASASTLGFELTSTLDDPNNRGATTPYAAFTFLLVRTVVMTDRQGGVQVLT